jgi:photosystem I subunit V
MTVAPRALSDVNVAISGGELYGWKAGEGERPCARDPLCFLSTRPRLTPCRSRNSTTPSQLSSHTATADSLFLGRFVFFEYQKKSAAKAGLPKQNGMTHLEAGDRLAAESSVVASSGDPAGFTIPLLLAWGAIGHALGYFALATHSLTEAGFKATPF